MVERGYGVLQLMSENDTKRHATGWRSSLTAVIAIAIGFAVAFLSGQDQAAPNQQAIVFYGDSLTAAYGLDPEQGYPAAIQRKLDDSPLGKDYYVIASAVSGETTAGGLSRLNWAMKAIGRSGNDVGVFMLALGANDGLRGQSVEAMKENLSAILTGVQERYPNATLILPTMLMPPNMGDEYRAAFRTAFGEVAQEHGATLIPFPLEGVAGNPELNLPDGIHPNPAGQEKIANNLWSVLQPILEQRISEN